MRYPISKILTNKTKSWSGQLFITGKNRVVIFILKHLHSNPSSIISLEHPEHFRGEHTYYNLKYILSKIRKKFFKNFI